MRQGKYTARRGRMALIKAEVIRRWRWFKALPLKKKILLIGGPILAFLILTPIVTYLYFANVIANPDRLMNHNRTGVVLEDKDGKVFYSFGTARQAELVKLDKISDHVENGLIAAEDQNFYEHSGVSFRSYLAAMYANFITQDPTAYGGSTITQQLVKNTLLTHEKSYLRKYQELFLAVAVERKYSKEEILEFYLNSVYFGEGAFGIEAAAKTYYGKTANELTLAESAMLVGLLPGPSLYSPISGDPELANEQQERVLERMQEEGYITESEQAKASKTKLSYADQEEDKSEAPHFAQMVLNELYEEYGEERVTRSGFVVRTSLDLEWQKAANEYVANQTAINAPLGGRNAAMIAQDPNSGEIRALVGSSDWDNKKFGKVNMAVTPRQPGSSFKPIYFTEAMARGLITPATHIKDEPINISGYEPENFDFAYRGDITVRDALSQSLNIPAVKVMDKLGVGEAIDTAQRLGIESIKHNQDYGLSLALGAGEVKLREMVNAYAAFANGGEQYESTAILKVDDKFGNEIYKYEPRDKRVMEEGATFLISDILSDNSARAPTFGSSLNLSRDTAVKTGSTDKDVDAWTIGFTPNVVVGVWVGNNEHEPMQLGGSGMAGPIWRQMMERAFQDLPNEEFQKPASVTQIRVCASNGGRVVGDGTDEGTYLEYFIEGHQPTETCQRQAPKDSDNDGVTDDNDKCNNTKRGVEVDDRGCEIEQEEEEEELADRDGDGVPDDFDECSNTQPGAEVDETGCEIEQDEGGPLDPGGGDGTTEDDPDGDGVVGSDDRCPNRPGPGTDDGCPSGDTGSFFMTPANRRYS